MKTTIELPDALAHDAKALAHSQGTTLRELVVEGLRNEVERRRGQQNLRVDFVFPTYGGEGLQPGVEWADLVEFSYDEPGASRHSR